MELIVPIGFLNGNAETETHFYFVVASRSENSVEGFLIFGETRKSAERQVFDLIKNQNFGTVEVYEPREAKIKMKRMPNAFFREISEKMPPKVKTVLPERCLRLKDLKVVVRR